MFNGIKAARDLCEVGANFGDRLDSHEPRPAFYIIYIMRSPVAGLAS